MQKTGRAEHHPALPLIRRRSAILKDTEELQTMADPDWDTPLQLTLTPAMLAHVLLETANAAHTGRQSCIEEAAILNQLVAMDDSGHHVVRLVEQEFTDEQEPEIIWHDWVVEICLGQIFIVGHWHVRIGTPAFEWEWHARQAEQAFERACVLLGRRVRRGLWVEEPAPRAVPPRSHRH